MKILQICHRVPYPPVDGGNIAMMNIALALADAGNEVHQFALNTSRHHVSESDIPEELRRLLHFHSAQVNTDIRFKDAFRNLFNDDSYNVIRFYSEEAEKLLAGVLQKNEFDIIQLETLFCTPYIPCIRHYSSAKIVLRAHNAEHIIWQRLAGSEKNPVRKKYISFLASRLKKYETGILKQIDALVPITKIDEAVFHSHDFRRPSKTIPLGIDPDEYEILPAAMAEPALFHLGSMDWLPNLEGVEWFLKKSWPLIHERFPLLKLYLAGRNFPAAIQNSGYPNVMCEGKIGDALDYMRGKQMMIVPLLSGSGMRVKIIQGLALGKTIISTATGAEGIEVTNEKNILLADTPAQFLQYITRCIENPAWCAEIGANGRKLIEEKYSNDAVGRDLTAFYRSL